MEIAYLAKGLSNLYSYFQKDSKLMGIEKALREHLIQRLNSDHMLMSSLEPYSLSKILRYLLKYNSETDD